jgi:hypothetical protein
LAQVWLRIYLDNFDRLDECASTVYGIVAPEFGMDEVKTALRQSDKTIDGALELPLGI